MNRHRGGHLFLTVLRLLVYPADILFSMLVLLSFFTAVALPLWLWYRVGCPRREPGLRVLLHTHEGRAVAPARVRCYGFALRLAAMAPRDCRVDVYSHWDDCFHLKGMPRRHRFKTELAYACLKSFLTMLSGRYNVVVDQRPNYHSAATLTYRFVTRSSMMADIDDWIFDGWLYLFPMRLRRWLGFIGSFADGCFVSSRHLETEARHLFPEVVLVPTFADETVFQPRPFPSRVEPVRFSWVGTIFDDASLRNVLFILEAFAKACSKIKATAELECLVGFNPLADRHYRRFETALADTYSGLPILCRSWLSPERIPEYLATVHVGLFALVDTSDFNKSKSPTKLFEYMASGRPVIATSMGEAGNFIDEGQTGFTADTPEDFAGAMVLLAQDRNLIEAMGSRARLAVEREYSATASMLRYVHVLAVQSRRRIRL